MKDLIIVGAGGFGREVEQWIGDINRVRPTWNVLGYINDDLHALDGLPTDYKIIGTIKDWQPKENEYFALALAFPKAKVKVASILKGRGAKFATLIHPASNVSKFAEIGEGTIITQRSGLNSNAKVGAFVSIIDSGCAHDSVIGDFSTLSGKVNINGHVTVGERVYIGCAASVAPGKKIGDDAQVGIGSVVISNVKAGTTVFGNPAKPLEM